MFRNDLVDEAGERFCSLDLFIDISEYKMTEERAKAGRQYVVFHLKMIEVIHLALLSLHLTDSGVCPANELNHSVARFKETLLSTTVTTFMALNDKSKSTNTRQIWKSLFSKHAKAIDRVWDRSITPGERVMKAYRDQAGAHGDDPYNYFVARVALLENEDRILTALSAFFRLSICLLNRQAKEIPELAGEIEAVLLDIELRFPRDQGFNRQWLKEMRLTEEGSYTKKYL
ncbi:hypothetical protein JAO29_11165 [Edaphobacter sp. HDX4]|uniref:hypothetical protein n=1 Tax=Edaphobacter sp. HDX4 TaxID=2794064 RepID=UPI002FE686BA